MDGEFSVAFLLF